MLQVDAQEWWVFNEGGRKMCLVWSSLDDLLWVLRFWMRHLQKRVYYVIRLLQSIGNLSARVRTTNWLFMIVIRKQEQMKSVIQKLWTQPSGCSHQHFLPGVPLLLILDLGHYSITAQQIWLTSETGKQSPFPLGNKSESLCINPALCFYLGCTRTWNFFSVLSTIAKLTHQKLPKKFETASEFTRDQ